MPGRFREDGPAARPGDRPPARDARPDLHRRLQPALLCVADLPPGPGGGHRRVRGGVGVLRGVFKIIIPDNMAPIVDKAHPTDPRLNRAFAEYAQDRGFAVDPARVRRPADKPRVERNVQFVRGSFFAGESFAGLADAQRKAEAWCAGRAGQRIHRTTRCRPAELFAAEEAPRLLPAPVFGYDLPVYASPKVHRDHHIEVAKALYSVPGNLIGRHVDVRADSQLVRVYHRGHLVKT